ncbi:MAG TPA: lipid carrier--UDP-N-acetylgalactosaminyltransferase [Chitinophagaceae bacterium]|nr:lipid carrier--UDP-N-acetylgalactosaminyltransferase [Chitinophagaceae bacterium]HRF25927.1 sugar transferase [Ferruginibacter sp.]
MRGNFLYDRVIKRIADFIAALIALLIFTPVMLIVIIALYLTGHKRVFFTQPRVGLNDKIFTLIKFRTMTEARDAEGNLLPDAQRLTRFGAMVRKTSLDELPQLINVLKGDMSLVGPRPLLVQYLPLYSAEQRKRHLVRPGITGWAQVNGRNAISWEQKFIYDVWYVEHQSLALDLNIFFKTIRNVVKAEGISQDGQATMEAFKGNN